MPATTARYGDCAESDKARPAAEGEYPRTPWQTHSWGNTPSSEAAEEEDSDNGFSAQFVKDAVNQLATNSSGGEDGITAELLRWVDSHHVAVIRGQVPEGSPKHDFGAEGKKEWHWPVIMGAIASCFNLFAAQGFIPAQWKRSKTLLIHKKGPHNELANYRPIAAGNTMGKLFSHCVKYRNTFAIKLLHKAYNQHQGAHPTPAHAQCRTAHRLSAGVRSHQACHWAWQACWCQAPPLLLLWCPLVAPCWAPAP